MEPKLMKINNIIPLDLQAVPFPMRPVWCLSTRGTPYQRWIPYGMPQLGQYKWISDTVFFLYPSEEHARLGTSYGGTGFFVAVPSQRWGEHFYHIHGVTNWHVACKGSSVIRINRLDGGVDIFDYGPEEWTFLPGGHDVAVSPPLSLDKSVHKVEAVWYGSLLDETAMTQDDIGPAEDVFMVGRFIDYDGGETNEAAYRFGNISIVNANMKQENGHWGNSIVIDMHSRTGYSGSPVWVFRTPGTVFSKRNEMTTTWHYIKLLGIHWGQFPENWQLHDKPSLAEISAQASLIVRGKYVEGLSGMTCVAPSSAIIATLADKKLRDMRAIKDDETPNLERMVRARATESGKHEASRLRRALSKELGLDQLRASGLF